MNYELDIARLEDDGAPPLPHPEVLPFRIGIAPEKPPAILSASGLPANPPKPVTWPEYCKWRETKCRPFDLGHPAWATNIPIPLPVSMRITEEDYAKRDRALEEIDQATHELVGEVAELGELILEHGVGAFRGEARAKFIDECGDILFCGSWALDAWGHNPLRDPESDPNGIWPEVVALDNNHIAVGIGRLLKLPGYVPDEADELSIMGLILSLFTEMQCQVGLTANAYKKLRFHRRKQDAEKQCLRISVAFVNVNILLILAGSSMTEAMESNKRKLDARYPLGYVDGQGGGIRTGDGK
jgi:hypothetical protein